MSELKDYDIMDIEAMDDERLEKSESGKIQVTRVYIKSDVDATIAELKRENERLVKCCKEYDARQRIDERIKFNGSKQLRATKRALWISRAKAYHYIAELIASFNPDFIRNRRMFTPNNLKQKQMDSLAWAHLMLEVERKCLAKAEQYK